MFFQNSNVKKLATGECLGFVCGLLGFFMIPNLLPGVDPRFKWGILMWYLTFGAVIAMSMTQLGDVYKVINIKIPWWLYLPWIGAWLNFVLSMLIPYKLYVMVSIITQGYLTSPYWMILEGAIIGFIIGYIIHKMDSKKHVTN